MLWPLLVLAAAVPQAWGITTERVVSGLSRPVAATAPASDPHRLFIAEQHTGLIEILDLDTGLINGSPFLAIDGLSTSNEQGLLGLAFHPDYATNGFFYANLTDATGTTLIRRYQVSADPNLADPSSATPVLSYSQPQANHNGGWLGFGPNDGYLYIASGDGGGGDDDDSGHTPGLGNAQDITNNLLGKILRIDVNADDFPGNPDRNYAVPPTNPFVGKVGDDEIWAYGLRNPWRPSFDRVTGDLYIADVGQQQREEVNFQPAASTGPENYGWRVMEGTRCHFNNDPLPCNDPNFTEPIHEYPHVSDPNGGFSLTGGYVYRGPRASLHGVYFFADYITDQIWTFRYDGVNKTEFANRTSEMVPPVGMIDDVSSFGQDALGNLYILDLNDGEVFKIVPEPVVAGDLDGDGFVDLNDFALFAFQWLRSSCGICSGADFDSNGTVEAQDLRQLAAQWLKGTQP